jgi:hypothetical protein
VPFFDDVLRTAFLQEPQRSQLFKAVIKLYSLPRNGHGSKVFIKTDSWHIMFYKQLRRLYPNVPFILLYRNPAEVIRSQSKKPGRHCIPQFVEPALLGITEAVITAEDFYNYPIKVVEKYQEAFINIIKEDSNAFLFNYKEGMLKVTEDIYRVIGLPFTAFDREQMQHRLQFHSKNTRLFFSPEPEIKSGDERFARVFELYSQLDGLRAGKQY